MSRNPNESSLAPQDSHISINPEDLEKMKEKDNKIINKTLAAFQRSPSTSFMVAKNKALEASRSPSPVMVREEQDQAKLLRDQLVSIQKAKLKSLMVQKNILESMSIPLKLPSLHSLEMKIDSLVKIKDYGLALEEIKLDVEKNYESIFTEFTKLVDALKKHMITLLDEQKKELFSKLLTEKSQNFSNFITFEAKVKELIAKKNETGTLSIHDQQTFDAFTNLFRFSKDFKQEFFNAITSRFKGFDLEQKKAELNKMVGNIVSQSLIAPKAFPTELIRFFEKNESKRIQELYSLNLDTGMYLSGRSAFPESLCMDLDPKPVDFEFRNSNNSSSK